MARSPIKVMVVDDSATIREFLRGALSQGGDIEVVASVPDPYFARDKLTQQRPDVIILDVEMPRMDGLTFLEKLMAAHPTPVVMFSVHTKEGAQSTFKALALGAVDFVAKPTSNLSERLEEVADELVAKVRAAAGAKVYHRVPTGILSAPSKVQVEQVVALTKPPPRPGGPMVVLMGASTGGTVALEQVLSCLPADSPPIAIVQHMPEHFTEAFAQRLDGCCRISVSEARDQEPLLPGQAVIAPGGSHLLLEEAEAGYRVRVKEGPPVNRHRPSVDVLFRSGVSSAGPNAVAVIMTGMGDDGVRGLQDLHEAGALTIAQHEASCTVYGMPRAAVEAGAVDRVLPLEHIAPLIMGLWSQDQERAAK